MNIAIRQGAGEGPARPVSEYVEKPVAKRAETMVKSGDYFWNSGMFLLPAQGYLDELGRLDPVMLAACRRAYEGAASDLDFVRLDKAAFEACRADSIDYAVMEKTGRASVVPLAAGWSDVGSFPALQEALGADASGNVTRGDVVAEASKDCLLYSTDRLVAAVGLEGHVVIETKDAVMVAPKGRAQDVKQLVERMKKAGRPEPGLHREVFRPWGSFDSVDAGPRFQVKRLTIKPGAKLSLQKHAHRAEHWVVVSGTARITYQNPSQDTLGEIWLRLYLRAFSSTDTTWMRESGGQLRGFGATATANTLAKLAHGFADDLVSTLCLATTAPITVAPAMNHRMWLHPATQANIETLRGRGVAIVGPNDGPLAEGESGPGRMSEPAQILAAVQQAFA